MVSARDTIELLEHCLSFMEDRYLSCFHGEPWCFVTLCAAIMLLRVRAGLDSRREAQSSCAHKFLDLHYKHAGKDHQNYSDASNSVAPTDSVDVSIFPYDPIAGEPASAQQVEAYYCE